VKTRSLTLLAIPLLAVCLSAIPFDEASARAGRGRSFGSGAGRSSFAPRPAPSHDAGRTSQAPSAQGAQPFQDRQGGMFRGMGGGLLGGLAGGLLGGMLFRSLGFAGAGVGTGGIGLFEILLVAGLLYLIYRFVASRRRESPAQASYRSGGENWTAGERFPPPFDGGARPAPDLSAEGGDAAAGLTHIRQFDPAFDEARFQEHAQDLFFKVQGAWTRRELSPIAALLTDEVRRTLQGDVDDLKRRREINRLENIAVRSARIVDAWQDQGQDFITVRFLASLLDYTTDESGRVLSGSDHEPVKFEEFWSFTRPVGGAQWRLSGLQQPQS
jgi:predicted lipid-binding transport protein (Tim44 family)